MSNRRPGQTLLPWETSWGPGLVGFLGPKGCPCACQQVCEPQSWLPIKKIKPRAF